MLLDSDAKRVTSRCMAFCSIGKVDSGELGSSTGSSMVDENVSVVGVQAHVSGGFQPSVGSLLNKALHDGTRLGVLGRGGRGALGDLLLSARKDKVLLMVR